MTENIETILENDFGGANILFRVIKEVLYSCYYVNMGENICLKICVQFLSKKRMENPVVNDLLHNYEALVAMGFPLQNVQL